MIQLKSIHNLCFKRKTVLLRVDFNLPKEKNEIKDKTRIIKALPTIKYLLRQGAKIVLLSHFGKPKGKVDNSLSLLFVVKILEDYLHQKVNFFSGIIDASLKNKIANMQFGEIALLENLRFFPGEELNDSEFVNQLSQLGDIYINDAFSSSHRKHASIYGIAQILPSAAGLLLLEELASINILFNNNTPFTVIIGGAKISNKLHLLDVLVDKADYLVIGGAMANSFLVAQGINIGLSIYEKDLVDTASLILQKAHITGCKIILPFDAATINNNIAVHKKKMNIIPKSVSVHNITNDDIIMDIGLHTLTEISRIVQESKTIVWNGPVGAFESPPFNYGSYYLAKTIAEATQKNNLCSVVGGGDTVSAVRQANLADHFSHISTGGGALLECLKSKDLPGIEVLRTKKYK